MATGGGGRHQALKLTMKIIHNIFLFATLALLCPITNAIQVPGNLSRNEARADGPCQMSDFIGTSPAHSLTLTHISDNIGKYKYSVFHGPRGPAVTNHILFGGR